MNKLLTLASIVVLTASTASQAQQSPSPQPPATPTQPCVISNTAAKPPSSNPGSSYLGRLRQKYDAATSKLEAKSPVPIPTSDDINNTLKTKAAPCPAQTIAPVAKPTAPSQAPHFNWPPDFIVSVRCSPAWPSSKYGAGEPTIFFWPVSDVPAIPKGNEIEADEVVPDSDARVPCKQIKVDPKTHKYFIQQ